MRLSSDDRGRGPQTITYLASVQLIKGPDQMARRSIRHLRRKRARRPLRRLGTPGRRRAT